MRVERILNLRRLDKLRQRRKSPVDFKTAATYMVELDPNAVDGSVPERVCQATTVSAGSVRTGPGYY